MPSSKKIDEAPWEKAAKTVVKPKETTKKKSGGFPVTVQSFGADTIVVFASEKERAAGLKAIAVRCSRGTSATLVASGKEYTFIPNLGVIISDAS